jgi:thiamine-phosphate pyrophosphorylase
LPPSQPTGWAPVTCQWYPGECESKLSPIIRRDEYSEVMAPENADALVDRRRRALAQARLYFVCCARPRGERPRPLLDAALRGGADIIQLRDKGAGDAELLAAARAFRQAADRHRALFILNDRPELVGACEADGVHVGQDDAPVAEARAFAPPGALVGLSTHSPQEVDEACAAEGEARPDQISVGPVWPTPTKAGRPAAGLELIEHAARAATIPWFAIGGIDESKLAEVVAAGASRIVVVRAIRDADDVQGAARALREPLEAATGGRA